MPITDQQIQGFKRHYDSKSTNYDCPICGVNDWQPENIVSLPHLKETENDYTPDFSTLTPVLPVRCKNCHHTRFFNAKLMGLLD